MNIFRKCNSKNLFCFWKLLNFFLNIDSKNKPLIFWQRVKELDFFLNVTQRIPFVKYDSNGTFFFKYDTKNWTFFEFDSKNGTFFKKKKSTHRIEPFFFEHDAKNWTLHFLNMTPRIGPFFKIWLKELNSFCWYDSKKWTLFEIWLTEWNFFLNLTHRIEPFSKYNWKNWTPFSDKTRRIELFFWIRLKELNIFEYDSKNLTLC